jgi:hypothetical protein
MVIKVTYNVTDVYVSETISATYINISYETPSGGSSVWGGITGTLSNQTDLQNALNAKFDDPTGTTSQYLRGDGTLATFPTITSGTVTSVGLTMPSAFSVANSPVTSSGTLTVTGAGTTAQYIRGDGSLDTFPSLTGFVPYTGATANVDLGTHTILSQNATISSSGSGNTATITHSSGSGIGLNITKGGNGEGLYINKTGGSGNAATIIGTLNATSLVKSGGTSTQYLMADGTTSTLTNPITGTGTSGQVAYFTGATTQSSSANFIFDATNNRLRLGGGADTGQRLQVTGDTLLKGSGNTSATTALTVQDSGGTNLINVRNDNLITYGTGLTLSQVGARITFSTIGGANVNQFRFTTTNTLFSPSGNTVFIDYLGNFNPTSGTSTFVGLQFTGSINQTGGANGITRGLYVNPTLTAAADWRSIEWSNNTGWGLYGAGTAQNYLAGNLGIGTTTINNSALRVNKAITGAVTQSSIANSSTINSDVTSNAWMYISSPSTQAAAFTISEVVHFNAFNLTIGASSAVTNNIGFKATSTLTGATNNWGFYGDIPSGTNRWNLYMNGTANNFLSGNTQIGTGALTSEKLQVNGTAKITSKMSMGAGTTSNAQINLASSTAPTSPNDGDIWFDGTNLKMQIGGLTKTFTLL